MSPLEGRRLRLTLTNGLVVERDVTELLQGPVFEALAADDELFRRVSVTHGTVSWPGGVDIAPETLIWGGPEPGGHPVPPDDLRARPPSRG